MKKTSKLRDDPLLYAASMLAYAAYDWIPGDARRNRGIVKNWEAIVKEYEAGTPHDGDCIGEPNSCLRCAVEKAVVRGRGLMQFLGDKEK